MTRNKIIFLCNGKQRKMIMSTIMNKFNHISDKFSNPNLLKKQYSVYSKNKFINLADDKTIKVKGNITETTLRNHTLGLQSISFTYTLMTEMFSLDIDVKGDLLSEELRTDELATLFSIVTMLIGHIPSLIFRSRTNGGIHLYYKLDRKYPFPIIHYHLKNLFRKYKKIEILPTTRKSLRFPFDTLNGGMKLDENLKPLEIINTNPYDFLKEHTAQARKYSLTEILGISEPTVQFLTAFENNKSIIRNTHNLIRFEKYNQEIGTPKQGETNEWIEKTCFNGFCNGITPKIIIEYIDKEFNRIYRDFDTSIKRITERTHSHYNRLKSSNLLVNLREQKEQDKQEIQIKFWGMINARIDKYFSAILEKFIQIPIRKDVKHGIRPEDITRRTNTLRNFLQELLKWEQYIRNLTNLERRLIDCQYQYFYGHTKKGLTPLPYNLMENWYYRYFLILPILKRMQLVKLGKPYFNPYKAKMYDNEIQGNCNYFQILF